MWFSTAILSTLPLRKNCGRYQRQSVIGIDQGADGLPVPHHAYWRVATTYSPITLSGVSDIEIIPGYIGLGDSDREVILRFAEPLPDDGYRIEIMGQGVRTLKNVNGEPFNAGGIELGGL